MPFTWRCPFCGQLATMQNHDVSSDTHVFRVPNKLGAAVGLRSTIMRCPNQECHQIAITAELNEFELGRGPQTPQWVPKSPSLQAWLLRPEARCRQLPDYVPEPIRNDYHEACRIVNLSPKASATLSRRCLQGMIRDFH